MRFSFLAHVPTNSQSERHLPEHNSARTCENKIMQERKSPKNATPVKMITNGSAMARYGLILCEDGDLGSRSLDLPLQDQLDSRFERKMGSIFWGKLGNMTFGAKVG